MALAQTAKTGAEEPLCDGQVASLGTQLPLEADSIRRKGAQMVPFGIFPEPSNRPSRSFQISQPELAIDAIDRMPRFRTTGSSAREALLNQQIACKNHAYEFGLDAADIVYWQWPF